jgi:alkylation response protein AidB-like acyl-CoA dehydrogenase
VSFQGFDLPDDLKMLSDTIAEFVRKEIVPVEASVPGDARAIPAADLAEHAWSSFSAISEPTGGSDPARAIRTTATRDGDVYRINGHKLWTTGADSARYGIVYARTDRTAGRGGRHLTWEAAWDADQGRDARTKASIAKLCGTETGFAVVDAMMQILGGMGMTKDMPLEHWFRGLRVARVVEGPSEIHRFLIARDMLGGAALGRGA